VRSERLVASSADREFTAKLTLPKGAGPFPAIVCVHPASDGTRDHFLFLHLEALLPPLGIAVARFDRRGNDVPFLDQVRDVEAVLEALAARPDIDATRLGLWAFDQGAWIAPLVATRSARVAFLILVAAAGVTPSAQLRHATGTQAVADEDLEFDPAPVIAAVHVPTLLFYGDDDEWQPTDLSVTAWKHAGTRDLMIARIPTTGHAPVAAGGTDVASVLPRYTDTLGAWIKRVARTG
jgi:pimeloyl-ACP methyl ester carboxylesterase